MTTMKKEKRMDKETLYKEIAISEEQFKKGEYKDAKVVAEELKKKYPFLDE